IALPLGRIETPEVFQHQTALLGGQVPELVPAGVAEPQARARRPWREQRRHVDAVGGRGTTDPLPLLVGLGAGEGATGVEQAPIQPLLALDRLGVEMARLELPGEVARLLRQRPRGLARALGAEPVALSASTDSSARAAAASTLGFASSICWRAARIWRWANPSARSSWGETSACLPAAARIWRPTTSVPSSREACCDRVADPS